MRTGVGVQRRRWQPARSRPPESGFAEGWPCTARYMLSLARLILLWRGLVTTGDKHQLPVLVGTSLSPAEGASLPNAEAIKNHLVANLA